MTDAELLALNVLQEAGGELDDGKAAVARVVLNRIAKRFFSDGTMIGTVLAKDQFSWAWFANVGGKYQRVCSSEPQAVARAQELLSQAPPAILAHCSDIAQAVVAKTYDGPDYANMTEAAMLYLNAPLTIKLSGHLPVWASPDKQVCVIGHHTFYRN